MTLSTFFVPFLFLIFLFSMGFLIAIYLRRSDFADSIWPIGFLAVSWINYLFFSFTTIYPFIINLLVSLWSLRLFLHIFLRNRKRGEDFRYQELQKNWRTHRFLQIYFKIFLFQGLILYIVSLPILWIQFSASSVNWIIFGLAFPIWLFGFLIETISDFQLTIFRKEKKNSGAILRSGLWSYCRHPNYFGEIIQWWAIWLFAIATPMGWITFIGPLLLTILIIFVSGVAPLEKKMKNHPEFEEYARSTPLLIPLLYSSNSADNISKNDNVKRKH